MNSQLKAEAHPVSPLKCVHLSFLQRPMTHSMEQSSTAGDSGGVDQRGDKTRQPGIEILTLVISYAALLRLSYIICELSRITSVGLQELRNLELVPKFLVQHRPYLN